MRELGKEKKHVLILVLKGYYKHNNHNINSFIPEEKLSYGKQIKKEV